MNFELLINNVKNAHQSTQQSAVKAVNVFLTVRNWLIGYYIVEFEQNGEDRAEYGQFLLKKLAKQVSIKGLGETNLKQSRKFFLTYPQIGQTASDLFHTKISQTASDLLEKPTADLIFDLTEQEDKYYTTIVNKISFSHFVELLKIDNPVKRKFYELFIIKTQPNVEELKNQIATLSFERFGLSNNQETALQELAAKIIPTHPSDAVNLYIFLIFFSFPTVI